MSERQGSNGPGTPGDGQAGNGRAGNGQVRERGPLYELRGVEKRYQRGGSVVRALSGVDLDIDGGEVVSVEGPSGSGKSTMLLLLGALDVPSAGRISFEGKELGKASDGTLTRIRMSELGFVFQQFNLIPTLSALENVTIAMAPMHMRKAERVERARGLLGQVGLEQRVDHLPSRLSGGEQQRVAIARALANRPRVVIADEPTGNLDSESAREVMRLLTHLHDANEITVIVATHDVEVAKYAERRIRMRDGAIVDDVRT